VAAYERQDVPFDRLVQALRPERSLDHSPLFQVMFILQSFPMDEVELAGIVAAPMELEIDTARFDLTVEVFPRQRELCAFFDYKVDLYEQETIERIQQHYLAILDAVCADPNQRIASIPLLSALERQKLLVDWNQTAANIPEDLFFNQEFERHASATPETSCGARQRRFAYLWRTGSARESNRRAFEKSAALARKNSWLSVFRAQ